MSAETRVQVVHRDPDLLVLNKPSGLSTTSPDGTNCLASNARELDPEAPRMHASSRLDAEVTGLVTFARSDRAIQALLAARKAGTYERCYLGLSARALEPSVGELRWAIGHDPRDARRRVALAPDGPEGAHALSKYRVRCVLPNVVLSFLFPQTGRTHQLRVHVAQAGAPLFGDKHYGGPTRVVLPDGRVVSARRVMLHCLQVKIPSPSGEGVLVLEAPVPADMLALFGALGGDPSLLELERLREDLRQEPNA